MGSVLIFLVIALIVVLRICTKILKKVLIVIISLAIIYCVMFTIDQKRIEANKDPIFVKEVSATENERELRGLGYKVLEKYDIIDGIKVLKQRELYFLNRCMAGIINDYDGDINTDILNELIDSGYAISNKIDNFSQQNFKKIFEFSYNQRKDLGIKEVADTGDYKIKTFGGDVEITFEGDMVMSLEDAIENNFIDPKDILLKCQDDEINGIVKTEQYNDGGSIEYLYDNYTILKLNTLDGDNDLIIGMKGPILNSYLEYK